MAEITFKGNTVNTVNNLPKMNKKAKNFNLTKTNLSQINLSNFANSKLILNIFPSLDTRTCAASVRRFNKEATSLDNTKVLCISRDLPFAQARFCGAEGIENVVVLSDFVSGEFGKNYGLEMTDGPLRHLHSRVVIVLDENGKVTYTQQVPEIADEPNYEEALNAVE